MTRKISTSVLLFLTLTLSACSYGTDFVIVNKSNDVIQIKYTFETDSNIDRRFPHKVTLRELQKSKIDWQAFQTDQYTLDLKSNSITVKILPQEALRLIQLSNYSPRHNDYFPIISLAIEGSNGSKSYEGKQAQNQFERESMLLYTITYE